MDSVSIAAGALVEAFFGCSVQRAICIARVSQLSRSFEEKLSRSSKAPRDSDGRLIVSSLHVDLVAHSAWYWQAVGKCRLNIRQLIVTGPARELAIFFPGVVQALSAEPLSRWAVREAIITEVEGQCLEVVLNIYIERLRDLVSALDSVHTSLGKLELHGITLWPQEWDLLLHELQGADPLELVLATNDCMHAFLASRLEGMGETRRTNGVLVCKTLSRSFRDSVASGEPERIESLDAEIVSRLREGGVWQGASDPLIGPGSSTLSDTAADELAEQRHRKVLEMSSGEVFGHEARRL